MFEFAALINGSLNEDTGPLGALRGLGLALSTATLSITSRINRLSGIAAEINRYIKDPRQKVITYPALSPRPASLADLKYSKYSYAELDSDRQIRLLKLQPGLDTDDLICCELIAVSLEDSPKYEALSYTWGSPLPEFPIVIASDAALKQLPITPALYGALKRLRLRDKERVLWIDQICINQAKNDEKSKQVPLMAELYEKAERTIVWLGEEDKDKEVLAEMVKLFAERSSSTLQNNIELIQPLLDFPSQQQIIQANAERARWRHQALVRLLNRQWFTRVWIFQEAVKSKTILMTCGGLQIPLDILQRLTQAVFEIEEESQGYAHSLTKSTTGFDTLYLIQHAKSEGCQDQDCERNGFKLNFLGTLMQALQQLEATLSHDLIYAFLAFRENVVIKVDYEASIPEVWTDAAKSIIKATGSLDVFAAVPGDQPCAHSIPSWVPDWSHCYPYARPICAPDFKSDFKAHHALLNPQDPRPSDVTCMHKWQDPFSNEPNTLIVSGKVIGSVSWLAPPNFEGRYYREGLKEVFMLDAHMKYLNMVLGTSTNTRSQHLRQGTKERLMRTMLADGAFGFTQPLKDSPAEIIRISDEEKQIEASCQAAGSGPLPPGTQLKKETLNRCRQWSLIVQQKKVILCEGAEDAVLDLGLAPKAVQPGDLVCVLRGSRVPCLLRKVGDDAERYRVIGQCYLDGWMYGDPPAGRKWAAGEITEFVLV